MNNRPDAKKSVSVDWSEVHRRIASIGASLDHNLRPAAEDKKAVLKKRAAVLAQEAPREAEEGQFLELVVFLLAGEKYGIESQFVREVYTLKELTPVPCTPEFVLGITNVRGEILSVIDIKQFFDLPRLGLNEYDKIVIVEFNGMKLGIRADAILGVQTIRLGQLQLSLPTLTGPGRKYLKGVMPDRLIVMDITRFLSDPDIIVNQEMQP